MRLQAIWLLGLAMVGLAASPEELGDIRFSLSLATPTRTTASDSVVLLLVEMRNASAFPVLASAGFRDPPIEVHVWNARGKDIVKLTNSEIADGTAFKETSSRRLAAVRFDAGEKVRFLIHLPMRLASGEYQIALRTAIQREASDSKSVVVVESNHVPVTLCNR